MAQRLKTQHGGEPNPLDTTGLCLLSLDGGGVRGLSSLYILSGIMSQLNREREKEGHQPVKPCEVFDLIGGTSTGGLIAIMLGRLEMDVDECIEQYGKLMEKVFETESSSWSWLDWLPFDRNFWIKSKFDSKKLKAAIEDVIVSKGGLIKDDFCDGKERGCRTFVCSIAKETGGVTRLRDYALPDERSISATICEAALATSAATGFFDPVTIGSRQFVDGALGANNPVLEVEGEAGNIWSPGDGDVKPQVKCFISIGTGNPGKKILEDNLLKFVSQTLVSLVTETEKTEKAFIARWAKHFDDGRFFRFNVDQGLQDVSLAEYKEKGRIETATDEYLTHQAQKFRVRDCVENMRQKQNRTSILFRVTIKDHEEHVIIHRHATTRAVHRNIPFQRNSRFIDHDNQLDNLENALFKISHSSKTAIFGLGGMGKTQIALELAYRISDKHPGCSIFWIPAISTDTLHQSFFEIGKKLGIPDIEKPGADIKALVKKCLSQESAGQWLLIVDNIDDLNLWNTDLKGFLPESPYGRCVFTTRNAQVAFRTCAKDLMEVKQMREEVAMKLLTKTLFRQDLLEDTENARKLLEELTFLPLAIVQAAAYINESFMTISEYLELLNKQEKEVVGLLSVDFEDDGRYPDTKNPVATTWLISFEEIRKRNPLASDYLSFMSCMLSKSIPRSILPLSKDGPSQKEMEAIGVLKAYSFITGHATEETFDIHRLVQLATRSWLSSRTPSADSGVTEQSVWIKRAASRLVEALPAKDFVEIDRKLRVTCLPHAIHVAASPGSYDDEDLLSLLKSIAYCHYTLGQYSAAECTARRYLKILQNLQGDNLEKALEIKGLLGLVLGGQARYAEAERVHREALDISEEKLGKSNTITVETLNNLASALVGQENYAEAEQMFRKCLDLIAQLPVKDDLTLYQCRSNFTVVLSRQGKLAEAKQTAEETLTLLERDVGKDHTITLSCKYNLAVLLAGPGVGQVAEAEKMFRDILILKEKLSGPEHPDTIQCIEGIGCCLAAQFKFEESLLFLERAHRGWLAALGPDYPVTQGVGGAIDYVRHKIDEQRAKPKSESPNFRPDTVGDFLARVQAFVLERLKA